MIVYTMAVTMVHLSKLTVNLSYNYVVGRCVLQS